MVTVITRTIGPTGRDYATFTLAEAATSSIGTSANLVANDEAIVFEVDAGLYEAAYIYSGGLTTDATRNVTYRPAAGSEHGGDKSAGVRHEHRDSQRTIVQDEFTVMEGMVFIPDSSPSGKYGPQLRGNGVTFRNCIVAMLGTNRDNLIVQKGSASAPARVENCVLNSDSSFSHRRTLKFEANNADLYAEIVNNTIVTTSDRAITCTGNSYNRDLTFINNVVIGTGAFHDYATSTTTVSGSNNFGPGTRPFPVAVQGTPYPVTATTSTSPGAGDWLIYRASNFQLDASSDNDVAGGGVGPAANSDVPTTGILGNARSGSTTQPGAFATLYSPVPVGPPTVVTGTVGPVGRDYATPALAEADIANLASGSDLVANNETVVIEIDAATYGSLAVSSTLTVDATHNVTYKAASGSEHGGSLTSGVILEASVNVLNIQDDFTTVEGLVAKGSGSYALVVTADGVTCRNLVLANTNSHVTIFQNGTATYPTRVENCVAHATNGYGYYVFGTSTAAHAVLVNCTLLYSFTTYGIRNYGDLANTTLINFLGLHTAGAAYQAVGTPTISGTNNFSTGTGALPAAVQGSPYPITATTSSTPGAGDWAIYVAGTGALQVVDANDMLGAGVGPTVNSDVPTTDIQGNRRYGASCDAGAFEMDRALSTDVWDVQTVSHTTPGSFGALVQDLPSAAEIATAVWDKLTADHQATGSFGELSQQTHIAADRAGSQRLE